MRRLIILFWLLLAVISLFGCAGKSIEPVVVTTQYTHKNDVAVGTFVYSAATTRGIRENQIENTAYGNFIIAKGVADIVRNVTALGIDQTGLKLNPQADISIYGDVTLFKADDLGYSIDWTYGIVYTIAKKNTGARLFSRHYTPPMITTPKFLSRASLDACLHNVIMQGYSMFISDPEVKAILDEAPATNG